MNKKIKILMTASTFPRWTGDTEPRFILDLAKALLPYCDVTVLVPDAPDTKKRDRIEGVHIIRYSYFPLKQLQTLCYPGAIVPRIKEKKRRILLVPFLLASLWIHLMKLSKDYDVIHAHWLVPQGIIQSFFHKPYLVTGHGGDVTSLNMAVLKKLKRRCLKKAAAITVVSVHLQKEICSIYPNSKTKVLPMGCWTDQFGKEYAVDNYFEQNNKKVILSVGRLAEKKGISFLIAAMEEVDAILVIAGEGPLEEKLKVQAESMGDKIRFIGPKTHDDLKKIYASADIFAAPSVTAGDGDTEGFGLVIIEAMASGLPVVASRSGGICDIINDGENGMLVPEKNSSELASAINKLIYDEKLYKSLSDQSTVTARKYDYRVIGKEYAKILRSIADQNKRT